MKTIAILGNGYWSKIIQKYTADYFNVKYIADSRFNLDKIWNDSKVDGVIIATPVDTHFDLTVQALHAKKHVFVEKPVAMTKEGCDSIKKAISKCGKQIGVEYTQTFSKAMKRIKRDLSLIGDVYFVEMSTKHLGRFTGYDVYWLLASHHLSILDMFCALGCFDVNKINHVIHNELCTTGSIELRNGLICARIDVSLDFPGKEMYAIFYGNKGTIKYTPLEDFSVTTTLFERVRGDSPEDITTSTSCYKMNEKDNLKYSMKYFDALMNGKAKSNIDMAIRVTDVLCRG